MNEKATRMYESLQGIFKNEIVRKLATTISQMDCVSSAERHGWIKR